MSPTREKYPLSKRKIIKKSLGLFLIFLIALIVAIVAQIILPDYLIDLEEAARVVIIAWVVVGYLFFQSIINWLYQIWYFKVYYYQLEGDYIVIRKDPITPREINIPYARVQDVYVDQDIFDRIFGLYDVHLSSATATSGMEAHIDGLEKEQAEGLRDELLSKIKEAKGITGGQVGQ